MPDKLLALEQWRKERKRVDLRAVVKAMLGEPTWRDQWPCPYCEQDFPSLLIKRGNKWWKCFKCGEWGDALDLVRSVKNISTIDAIEFIHKDPSFWLDKK